jgi:hypothetical protein
MFEIANVIPVVISRKCAHPILASVDGATAPTDPNSSDFDAMVDFEMAYREYPRQSLPDSKLAR